MGERLSGTVLERGQVLPGTSIRDADAGGDLRILDLRGRRALVLCFLHEDCPPCARFMESLGAAASDIAAAGARVIRLVPGDPTVRRHLGERGELPTVVITDRDAAAWEAYPASGHDFPPVTEVTETLWHLATMCPECGVATWG